MINDEDELKCMMEYSELFNLNKEENLKKKVPTLNKSIMVNELMNEYKESVLNFNYTAMMNNSTKEKMMNIKIKYANSLQYPINCILEYIISIYSIFEKNEEKEILYEKIEGVN
jgi:hypothetical protein